MRTGGATGGPTPRLACPGVADPMETGDGWLLRVRLPGGAVHPDQLDVVAEVSEQWGRGIVEITARGNLQLRGVAAGAVDTAAGALVDAGLALPDPALDARRGVVAPPLTGHDVREAVGADGLVDGLVAALVAAELPVALAPKFGVVIDTGGAIAVSAVPADLLLVAGDNGGGVTWTASIGDAAAPRWSGRCGGDDLVALAVAVATRCAGRGCRAAELPDADVDAIAAGRPATPPPVRRTTGPAASVGVWDHVERARASVVGAPSLRRLRPADVHRVAAAARRGLGVRFSPSGTVAVVGVGRDELGAVTAELHAAGCTTDPHDGRHIVSACVGTDGCASARADTLAAATALMAGPRTGRTVHLSGCEKRCGAPAGAVVLVADDADRFEEAP